MPLPIAWFAAGLLISTPAEPARVLCLYGGEVDARTTLEQEFADSRWVVRARVVSAFNSWTDHPDAAPWTTYRLQVVESFKGEAPDSMTFFTDRNSGGFYMDLPQGGGPDVGGEYLLFLNPMTPRPDDPPEARGAVFVNYSCGQSRAWREVAASDRAALARLKR